MVVVSVACSLGVGVGVVEDVVVVVVGAGWFGSWPGSPDPPKSHLMRRARRFCSTSGLGNLVFCDVVVSRSWGWLVLVLV